MALLLDTHAVIWWLEGHARLSPRARDLIENPPAPIRVSAASAWEIATKARLGKLPSMVPYAGRLLEVLQSQKFEPLDVSVRHADRAGALSGPLRDPFDRMLIAQAQLEGLNLISNEKVFDRYGVTRVW
ncbi:MAG: type II toxin-antitoxin system VapC family toxin [Rhodospirillaceae bacterium]|nr:type II toxin-antitoxin system VapC family toxin [Rhodospirillaceae bacterium]